MGDQYYYGTDVVQSYAQAYSLYKLSAAQGNLPGIINMGTMHQLGLGTDQSNAIARKFWSKAAKAGFERAQKYLAALDQFEKGGTGGEKSDGKSEGKSEGKSQEVDCIDGRQSTALTSTPSSILKNKRQSKARNRNGSIYAVRSV